MKQGLDIDAAAPSTHRHPMSLLAGISTAPRAYDAALGQATRAEFSDAPPQMQALLAGVAGCSPYLRGLIDKEAEWLRQIWDDPPQTSISNVMGNIASTGFDQLAADLRQAKQRVALVTALADLGGVWSLSDVTVALTGFADFVVQSALNALTIAEIERGKLPGCDPENGVAGTGLVALAMGKMGAHELNYSSDIDLIVVFDENQHDQADFDAIRAGLIRVTRRMCKLLSDVTAEGYVFRTDLRLRPDPSVTPVCLSMGAAERYYESLGRTWERAAHIKARPAAGDLAAGAAYLERLRPFIWRKHLDFAAIQDAHDMRLRIREHKGLGGAITMAGHDLKLGRGGIREIEFFTQTRQIIAGGRDLGLRCRGTVDGLKILAKKGWIESETATALEDSYVSHRTLEHRLQMIADAQTHTLPTTQEAFDRLTAFCDEIDTDAFRESMRVTFEMVHALTESFFSPEEPEPPDENLLSEASREAMDRWNNAPALRSPRAAEIFQRLRPRFIERLKRAPNPEEAFHQLDGFILGLPSGVQLFSLLQANDHLIDLIVDICATSPSLARYMSRNAQVFDAVIGGSFFDPLPVVGTMTSDLRETIAAIDDYEDQLNAVRRWTKERKFRVGVHHLQGLIADDLIGLHYADIAQAALAVLLPAVCKTFAKRHGDLPGKGAVVLAMGSLGAQQLSVASDLDLIIIYDADGQDSSVGPKPLAVSTYFSRLTQALVTALSTPTAEGRLYDVDMRLRPTGRKGPVAVSIESFEDYQCNHAWTWEHLALTRARVVAGSPAISKRVEGFRKDLLAADWDTQKIVEDVIEMRQRLADAADPATVAGNFEAKQGQGRLLDVELLAQATALLSGSSERGSAGQIMAGHRAGVLTAAEAETLADALKTFARLQQISRLLADGSLQANSLGDGGCEMLLRGTGHRTLAAYQQSLADKREAAARVIGRWLAQSSPAAKRGSQAGTPQSDNT